MALTPSNHQGAGDPYIRDLGVAGYVADTSLNDGMSSLDCQGRSCVGGAFGAIAAAAGPFRKRPAAPAAVKW